MCCKVLCGFVHLFAAQLQRGGGRRGASRHGGQIQSNREYRFAVKVSTCNNLPSKIWCGGITNQS
jgi:hypothetical protein